ncbi:hypothetical protein PSTG_03931 [Puccinia striiformis f. sp. tritici PST-78]|uniref:Uncharacterized protein n=1 Tax=Puccinia striiformis f. sp. tritici PST-78 TaxID=1165861 RepID=A0A0L0VUP6_9BASI|nr:hypothetical protein PSTG_03931 [Puccinia striiformis f. sp. tritici PST-78]
MKCKRTSPQKQTTATSSSSTSTINRTLSQPESPDVIETHVEDANKQPQSAKRSWVWLHLKETEDRCVSRIVENTTQEMESTDNSTLPRHSEYHRNPSGAEDTPLFGHLSQGHAVAQPVVMVT